jgi:CubicO group peptidase (beta-lactamase class C family)
LRSGSSWTFSDDPMSAPSLRGLERYGRITSIVVSRGDDVVYETYREGDAETLRNTRSCTKTVLGMIVGAAVARGLIEGVDAKIGDLLPDRRAISYDDPRKSALDIRQLLTMSSCLECDDSNPDSAGNEERMYPREDWLQFALDLPVRGDNGFSHCTAGVVALGVAVASALGEPLSAFAAREVFPAAGIDRFSWPLTPLGEDSAAGGLELTSSGLLELGRLYLDGGRDVVSNDWIDESTRAHATVDARTAYGYLWWLRSFGGHFSYYMAGAGGNRVHVFPDLHLVLVITAANFGVPGAHDWSDRLLEDVLTRLS